MDTTTSTGLRGLALLDAAIAQIENHPETWEQQSYRCGTGMCVAGWICQLAGGRWAAGPDDEFGDSLIAEPDDDGAVYVYTHGGRDVVDAASRAFRLLGTRDIYAGETSLFGAFNTLADIKRIRDELAARGLS